MNERTEGGEGIELYRPTDPRWVEAVLADFDAFLLDHATCERKAAATGLMFVVRYPDRTPLIDPLIAHAREELKHFHDVARLVLERGLRLRSDTAEPYAVEMMAHCRHGRDDRLVDRLLVAGLLEARGAERFGLLAAALESPDLRRFYETLTQADRRHQALFLHLAQACFDEEEVRDRLHTLAAAESEVVRTLPIRAALY